MVVGGTCLGKGNCGEPHPRDLDFHRPFGERLWMSRTLTLLFRRDPSRDRMYDSANFEGYRILWPDGEPVGVGVDAFCKHGQRLLGLGKHLANCSEKMIKMICFHLEGR